MILESNRLLNCIFVKQRLVHNEKADEMQSTDARWWLVTFDNFRKGKQTKVKNNSSIEKCGGIKNMNKFYLRCITHWEYSAKF